MKSWGEFRRQVSENEDSHKDLIDRLNATKGTEEFETVFDKIKDKSAKELSAIANDFHGRPARNKGDALQKIRSRHDDLVDLKARARATGDRGGRLMTQKLSQYYVHP